MNQADEDEKRFKKIQEKSAELLSQFRQRFDGRPISDKGVKLAAQIRPDGKGNFHVVLEKGIVTAVTMEDWGRAIPLSACYVLSSGGYRLYGYEISGAGKLVAEYQTVETLLDAVEKEVAAMGVGPKM